MILRALCFLAICLMAWSQQVGKAQAQTPKKTIAIILDSSRSMVNVSPGRPSLSREDHALIKLDEVMERIERNSPNADVSLTVFGSTFDWPSYRRRLKRGDPGRRPENYPADGPGCRDITTPVTYGKFSQNQRAAIRRAAAAASPSGMTPIAQTIDSLLENFRKKEDFEIVIITDFDAPNCLGESKNICGALRNLDGFIRRTGRRPSVGVVSLVASDLIEQLEECLPTRDVEKDPEPEPEPERYALGVELVYDPRPLGGIAPNTANYAIRLRDGSGRTLGSWPDFPQLLAGSYVVTADRSRVSREARISLPRNRVARIAVPPGTVTISLEDSDGRKISRDAEVVFVGNGRRIPAGNLNRTDTFSLPAGNWTAKLTLGDSEVESEPFNLQDGEEYPLAIELRGVQRTEVPNPISEPPKEPDVQQAEIPQPLPQSEAGPRRTIIDVRYGRPSLLVNAAAQDQVRLFLDGKELASLNPGLSRQFELEPNTYLVEVGDTDPVRLRVTVPEGPGTHIIELNVTPGWFHAESSNSGRFNLYRSKERVASFEGRRVAHSLPSGTYSLEFDDGTIQPPPVQEFSIGSGRVENIRF